MTLYIKSGCPWCDDAEAWMQARGISYQAIDVLSDAPSFAAMRKLSGQSKAPVLVSEDGRVLADFGVEELPRFLGQTVQS